MELFDYVKCINSGEKKNIEVDNNYVPFLVGRAFSFYPDTVKVASVINRYPDIDKRGHFLFLSHAIRPRKRFSKWHRFDKDLKDRILEIAKYYNISFAKAKEAYKIIGDTKLPNVKGGIT